MLRRDEKGQSFDCPNIFTISLSEENVNLSGKKNGKSLFCTENTELIRALLLLHEEQFYGIL